MRAVTTPSLAEWYRSAARVLPWRRQPRNPYHVLVSEFMLQQTQVDRVVPRFESFVRRFPSFESLADASEDEVVAEWSGLGYYRRARMLHRLAREVAQRRDGLPTSASELVNLPGIGPYTAAAVASMAFGEAAPVFDGNIARVGARVLGMEGDPRAAGRRRRIEGWVLELMAGHRPGEINEALMELGATVCAPVDPTCSQCPLGPACEAKRLGRQGDFPRPRRRRTAVSMRWAAACVVDSSGRWLVQRVEEGPVLRGLWLPPLARVQDDEEPATVAAQLVAGLEVSAAAVLAPVRHHITHRKIDVIPVRFDIAEPKRAPETWRWIDPLDVSVPTSSLLAKLVAAFES